MLHTSTLTSYYDDKIEKVIGTHSVQFREYIDASEFIYNSAMSKLNDIAVKEGADAIIGIQVTTVNAAHYMFMTITGTLVQIKDEHLPLIHN